MADKKVDPKDLSEEKTNRQLRAAVKKEVRTPEQSRYALKRLVKLFYDYQRLRIQAAGRTYDRATEIDLAEADIAVLGRRANELGVLEKEVLKDIQAHLSTMPVYNQILADKVRFKGIGPTMAGVILSEVDITRCGTVSALWKYAGLAPVPGRRCMKCNDEVKSVAADVRGKLYVHAFKRTDKCEMAGKEIPERDTFVSGHSQRGEKGTKLPFNRFFKTKMVGVMGSCMIKANSPYRSYYDDYKHRLQSAKKGRTDGHRHQMAMRYMVKMCLKDIWTDWRKLEGLDVRNSYQEQYLGHTHSA